MAAPSDDRNQQQQQQNEEEEVAAGGSRQPSPDDAARAALERMPDGQVVRRRADLSAAQVGARSMRMCRSMLETLLEYFADIPVCRRALEGIGDTLTAAERAVVWARNRTARYPVPLVWFIMMPIVLGLRIVRTAAYLLQRYLDVEQPDNRELAAWLESQRVELESQQAPAALEIRHTQAAARQDRSLRFLNRFPFNIPYRAAQQFRVLQVTIEDPSDTGSASATVGERLSAPSVSESSTLLANEAQAVPSTGERTPPPESAGDQRIYFSPEADKAAKEQAESEGQQDSTQAEAEGEKARKAAIEKACIEQVSKILQLDIHAFSTVALQAQGGKAGGKAAKAAGGAGKSEEHPEQPAAASAAAAAAATSERLSAEEAERAVMSVKAQPSARTASSKDLLAAEGSSQAEPGPSKSAEKPKPKAKAKSKARKGKLFRN